MKKSQPHYICYKVKANIQDCCNKVRDKGNHQQLPSSLWTEWIETKEPINKSTRLLQQEVFNRFTADKDAALMTSAFDVEYLSQDWRITRIVEFEIECAYNKVEEGF